MKTFFTAVLFSLLAANAFSSDSEVSPLCREAALSAAVEYGFSTEEHVFLAGGLSDSDMIVKVFKKDSLEDVYTLWMIGEIENGKCVIDVNDCGP